MAAPPISRDLGTRLGLGVPIQLNNAPADKLTDTNFKQVPVDEPTSNIGNTTHNIVDANAETASIPAKTIIPKFFMNVGDISGEQSLKDFFGKPVKLADGVFQTTDTVSTFNPYILPQEALAVTMWADKLKGYVGFRPEFEAILQINATRFQQGRYMLTWVPSAGAQYNPKQLMIKKMHTFSLQQRTQLPHVDIDLNTDSQVTLHIPYVSAYPYFPIYPAGNSWKPYNLGSLQIFPYKAINSGTASYTLWLRMKNVVLMAPTVPQSVSPKFDFSHVKTVPQSGRVKSSRKGKSETEYEQDSQGIGPITGIARKVKNASDVIGQIPLLSSFTEPVGWVADIVGNVASIFGWSKPVSESALTRVFPARGYFSTNYDASDISSVLAGSTRNQLQVCPGFSGTNLDEMSLDYLKFIPAWFKTQNWATTDAKEALLYSFNLCPDAFGQSYTDNGNTVYSYPPCSFPEIFMTRYRGSFVLTIKIVKTEFHSGRLAVVFEPLGGTNIAPTVTYDDTAFCHREIIDVRFGNEWTFEFPYVNHLSYLYIGRPYGKVRIYVVDPLIAPATVSSSVDLLLEISGGKDLEYAFPNHTAFCPYIPSAPQCKITKSGTRAQSSKVQMNFENNVEKSIGQTNSNDMEVGFAALCMGEKVLSLRQLVKRMNIRARTVAIPKANYYNYIPFAWSPVADNVAAAPYLPVLQPDMYTWCSSLYALCRGGVRWKFFNPAMTDVTGSSITYVRDAWGSTHDFRKEIYAEATDWGGIAGPAAISQSLAAYTVNGKEGLIAESQFAMYSSSNCFPTTDTCTYFTASIGNYSNGIDSASPPIFASTTFTDAETDMPAPLRGGADDLEFGCFISTPPLYVGPWLDNWT